MNITHIGGKHFCKKCMDMVTVYLVAPGLWRCMECKEIVVDDYKEKDKP